MVRMCLYCGKVGGIAGGDKKWEMGESSLLPRATLG